MSDHLQFVILGLGSGAVFAALALAVVVVYRSSGVFNFATGAIALYAAYTYAFLRQGEFLVMVPGLPTTIPLGGDPGLLPAILLTVAVTALLGALLYVAVFRPLRSAPPLANAVASIGLMVMFTELAVLRVGTAPLSVAPIFPVDAWTVGQVRVPQDRVYFAVTVVGMALCLAALYRFTRFGLLTRASAETEKGAYVSGLSPDRIAIKNWMIGTGAAGLAGILIAPIVPLAPTAYTLFIVPALAAAVLGRFSSVVGATLAGLAIGMLQSEATYLQSSVDWLPSTGLVELVPLALILLVLVVRARPLPSRGAVTVSSLGRAPRPHRLLPSTVLGAGLGALALMVTSGVWRSGLITSLVFAVIALSLTVVMGFAGQVSLAQLTIAGAAGFLLGPFSADLGLPFPVAPLVAALVAAALGVVVGLPALRIRGLSVAVVTLALAHAIEAIWFRNSSIVGAAGVDIPAPSLFGWDLGIGGGDGYPRLRFGFLCLAVLVLVALGVALLRRSPLGARMLAVRANERSASAVGINVVRTKITAFAIGAFVAGIGGSLFAYQQTNVSFEPFSTLAGLSVLAIVYLAGITSVSGGIVAGLLCSGGIVFVALSELAGDAEWYPVAVGFALVLTVLLNPEGITGPVHAMLSSRRRASKAGEARGPVGSAAGSRTDGSVAWSAPRVRDLAGLPALSVRGVTVRYGGVVAVRDVGFDVARGSIVGLIGPNGAGKTTLIDAISGFAPAAGSVYLGAEEIDDLPPYRRSRAGMTRTFQAVELYEDLSVRENVVVGSTAHRSTRTDSHRAVVEVLDLLGLTEVAEVAAGELSQGQRQLVSIARALACRPDVLLLDEPAGGLDSRESQWLGDKLRKVSDAGIAIVLVEHDMHLVLNLCDHIEVLDFGEQLASGPPDHVRRDPAVAAAYLGSAHAEVAVS
ncbi:ABC transporter permease subunit [Marmoricola sp. RAF53]|uniref:ABC transporter permease subunit n=1 Tax=Marmoricola sp. RAF53 TaxID=3233059 RepID=UPI003F98F6D0